jgi:hypothetical protein
MKTHRSESPHWVFWSTGGGMIVIAILARLIEGKFWNVASDVALNIGLAIIAVSVIDWLWRRIGGDPLINAISELKNSTNLLSDLNGTGLKRAFINRSLSSDYRRLLIEKMYNAGEVDMLGIALRSGWASTNEFQEAIKSRLINKKLHFRIAVFDPEADVTKQRSFEEDGRHTQRIAESASSTLRIMVGIRNELPEQTRKNMEIKAVNETGIYCSIIRVDDVMLVTKYLLHLSGSNSETFIIEGRDNTYFKLYQEEFEAVWKRSVNWTK